MARLTKAEAKMKAAQFALDKLVGPFPGLEIHYGVDWPMVLAELKLIEAWLRDRACGGDAVLRRQFGRETGRQAKPTGKMAKQIERLVKKTGLDG